MIITPLGHTQLLIDIDSQTGQTVRILMDSWLSRYSVGDLMERSVTVDLDPSTLSTIDAIYLSHSHTDHIDPYTLRQIYEHASPVLLIAETISYLIPLLRQYLGEIEIIPLSNKRPHHFRGVEITAVALDLDEVTNEDDVMMLSIATDREILFAEIDTLIPETPEAYSWLYRHFSRRSYETICYLSTRNELEGNLAILDQPPSTRKKWATNYLHTRREQIEWGYAKWGCEEWEGVENFLELPGFCRGFIGQGIIYPQMVSPELSGVSIFPLAQVVDREVGFSTQYGFDFPQKALTPGRQYRVERGAIETGRKECSIGHLSTHQISTTIESAPARIYAQGPLLGRNGIVWTTEYETRMIDLLTHRFLPYWSASLLGNIREALSQSPDRTYRISIRDDEGVERVWSYGFSMVGWVQDGGVETISREKIHESYFLSDILGFLDGRLELYSSFWHPIPAGKMYRLWTGLGANWCNNDLILQKYQYHFDRAWSGGGVEEWTEEILTTIMDDQGRITN